MTAKGAGGRLTTHVLDTAEGRPAAGMILTLFRIEGADRRALGRFRTNADGRCDAPLLDGAAVKPGRYVLTFDAGDYFRRKGMVLADPPFLDTVRIAFGIADPSAHYHVPLLISPYGYSTYRGS